MQQQRVSVRGWKGLESSRSNFWILFQVCQYVKTMLFVRSTSTRPRTTNVLAQLESMVKFAREILSEESRILMILWWLKVKTVSSLQQPQLLRPRQPRRQPQQRRIHAPDRLASTVERVLPLETATTATVEYYIPDWLAAHSLTHARPIHASTTVSVRLMPTSIHTTLVHAQVASSVKYLTRSPII